MSSEPKSQPELQSVVELDREAWNLPSPSVAPVGPVRDAWPVRSSPSKGVDESVPQGPAPA
jgi:hypothetical protein